MKNMMIILNCLQHFIFIAMFSFYHSSCSSNKVVVFVLINKNNKNKNNNYNNNTYKVL